MADTFTPTREQIDAVETWRALPPETRVDRPLLPLLRQRFGISAMEAFKVIRAANGREGAR